MRQNKSRNQIYPFNPIDKLTNRKKGKFIKNLSTSKKGMLIINKATEVAQKIKKKS